MTKRVLAIVVAALMVLGTFTFVSADAAMTVTLTQNIDATTKGEGEYFTVPITIDKLPEGKLSMIQIFFDFDSSMMEIASATRAMKVWDVAGDTDEEGNPIPALVNASWTCKAGGDNVLFSDSSAGDASFTQESVDASKTLVTIRFKRLADATGTADLKINKIVATDRKNVATGTTYRYLPEDAGSTIGVVNTTVKFSEAVAPKSDNADITALKVTNGSEGEYVATVDGVDPLKYTVTVPSTVAEVTVVPTLADSKASVTAPASMASGTLSEGANPFSFTVTAEDGKTKKVYSLTITKEAAPKSSNAYLSALAANVGTAITFDKDTLTYDLGEVENSVDKVTITATAEDTKATVNGTGEKALAVGSNELKVIVTAEDGTTTKTYTINVTRKALVVAGAKVTGSADKTEANANEDVVVTVDFTELDTSSALQYELTYDKDAFEYVSSSLGEGANVATEGTVKAAAAQATAFTGGEFSATFTFKAKAVAADKAASFVIENAKYGSKDTEPLYWAAVDAANYTQAGSVTVKSAGDPVEIAKAEAIAAINAKVAELEAANEYFSDANLDSTKTEAIANINAATDVAGVTSAKDAGIAALGAVKTKADLIAEKKAANAAAAPDKADYFEESAANIDAAVAAADALADAAATKAALDAIAPDFTTGIKTKATVIADAKSEIGTAKALYTSADYYDEQLAEIAAIATTAETDVEAATVTKESEVASIVADAKTAMAAVKKKPVVALEKINDTETAYTVDLFTDAGVTGALEGKLNAYKLGVKDAAKTLTLAEVQAIVDDMNAAAPAVSGDLNANGAVDAGDAAIVLKYVAGTLPTSVVVDATFLVTADVNADGAITSADAASILATVLGK